MFFSSGMVPPPKLVLLNIRSVCYLRKLMCGTAKTVMYCRHFLFTHVAVVSAWGQCFSIYILFVIHIELWTLSVNICCITVYIIYLLSTQQCKKDDHPSRSSTRSEICETTCALSWNSLMLGCFSSFINLQIWSSFSWRSDISNNIKFYYPEVAKYLTRVKP
jgi:hypothetical protein